MVRRADHNQESSWMAYANRKGIAPIVAVVSALMLVGCQPGGSPKDSQAVTTGQKFSLFSKVLGEEREFLVYLPESYNSEIFAPQAYPVLYLLDGGPHFPWVSGVVNFMSSGINDNRQIPELIVVAIPNTNRMRDLTPTHTLVGLDGEESDRLKASGGGNAFLQFIRYELFAEIDSQYRTLPHRTIVGHSLGGLLALHALLEDPELFQAYIAIDPSLWWDEQLLVRQAEQVFASDQARSGSVYISLAGRSDLGAPNLMDEASRKFAGILASNASPGIRSTLQYFEAEDHVSIPLLGLYHGLLSTFDGYQISFDDIIERPTEVISHFEQVSDQLGVEFLPPESLMNRYGLLLVNRFDKPEEGLELLAINARNYPDSANVYDSLGEAYRTTGNSRLAIENFERSLVTNPSHFWAESAKEKLKELKE